MGFDIDLVTSSFKECLQENLDLKTYNRAYNELYSFFVVLGSMFGFIASDVKEKIDILEDFRKESENKEHYVHMEGMMLQEIEVNKNDKKIPLHGSRTLLRLHRALEFTKLFLDGLARSGNDEKVSTLALKSYSDSLSKFHPWYIRKPAQVAMYTLPTRKHLIDNIAKDVDEDLLRQKLSEAVQAMNDVYIATESLYTQYDLHSLP